MARTITLIPATKTLQNDALREMIPRKRTAAYCRVSTNLEEQLQSYETQRRYYTEYIRKNESYAFAGIYADEGISGTSTRRRTEFLKMIQDCRDGKIDLIITKSISRFARNTLDCLNYVRELKGLGIGIIFEKENIYTLDARGEVLLTILSSLAQDESRSISENTAWGIHKRYEAGHYGIATRRFLGYDSDADGHLIVNRAQAELVRRIYREYLDGKTVQMIAREFESEGIPNWHGNAVWIPTTLDSILQNEKYKGDALLQKTYSADFLSKKRRPNNGVLNQIQILEDHEPIVGREMWEAAQLERERRRAFCAEHGARTYANHPEKNCFDHKVVCGLCGKLYTPQYFCACGAELENAFESAWNEILRTKEQRRQGWIRMAAEGNDLQRYRAKRFMELAETETPCRVDGEFNLGLMLATMEKITVLPDGGMIVSLLE